jgi:hypothetical protein
VTFKEEREEKNEGGGKVPLGLTTLVVSVLNLKNAQRR